MGSEKPLNGLSGCGVKTTNSCSNSSEGSDSEESASETEEINDSKQTGSNKENIGDLKRKHEGEAADVGVEPMVMDQSNIDANANKRVCEDLKSDSKGE